MTFFFLHFSLFDTQNIWGHISVVCLFFMPFHAVNRSGRIPFIVRVRMIRKISFINSMWRSSVWYGDDGQITMKFNSTNMFCHPRRLSRKCTGLIPFNVRICFSYNFSGTKCVDLFLPVFIPTFLLDSRRNRKI